MRFGYEQLNWLVSSPLLQHTDPHFQAAVRRLQTDELLTIGELVEARAGGTDQTEAVIATWEHSLREFDSLCTLRDAN